MDMLLRIIRDLPGTVDYLRTHVAQRIQPNSGLEGRGEGLFGAL
jgi:hypothetical protein